MKNAILLILFSGLISFINPANAQPTCPCPERFELTDSACTRIGIFKNGNGFFVSDSIRACMGSTFTYSIYPVSAGCLYPGIAYTYSVSNGTLISNSGAQFTIQWGNSSPASVTINYSYSSGPGIHCVGSFTVNALLTQNPVAAFSISPNPACFNNPTTINFNSNASLNAVNYFWDFGDGFYGSGPNPTHNYSLPGTYVVTLIVSSPNGTGGGGTVPNSDPCPECSDSVKHTLLINNLPGPPIECIATVCADEEATYCTPSLPCATYTWTVTGGAITSGQGTPCITVLWGNGNPQGTINLVITGCPNYCAQGTTVNVPIIPPVTTITGDSIVCVNSTVGYSLPVFPGTTYNWNISGGGNIIGNNTNTAQVVVNWTTVGNFVVTCNYYDSSKGCGGVGTRTVKVLPSANIQGNKTFCAGSSTTLTVQNQFNVPIPATWSVSPPGTSFVGGNTGPTVTITSNTPGTYTVTATPPVGLVCSPPTYTITVLPKPILNPIIGADSICPGNTYVYAVSSNTVAPFTWTITNGTASYLSVNNDSAQITWGANGPYQISITQVSTAGCISTPQILNIAAIPSPVITGPTNVCADAIVSYSILNTGPRPFTWSVSPPNYGTIQSGQGTNTITIKWHGSVNPGSNTVYLHVSLCKDDSIAITINKPVTPTITPGGSLCGGGVTLAASGTGTFSWTCAENGYTSNNQTATGITLPGHYTVAISNYNGTGCTVSATYFVPDIGRPVANISANNVLNYCLPNVPNMSLVAAAGAGYNYQWYLSPATPVGTNSPTLPVNSLNTAGSYTYYCVVTLNGCSVTSNTITIVLQNCTGNPGGPGCTGMLGISSITGCNPFTVTPVALAPAGGTVVGGTTIISYPASPATSGNITMNFDSVGYKQITVCADIFDPGSGTTTRCCKDTVVLVTVAAKFLANDSCGIISLTDLSTVIFPATISGYNWNVGSFPGNSPVPPVVASFNNPATASPVLTVTVTGQYIITQQVTSGSCTVSFMDTVSVSVPDASFTVSSSCVGTPVMLNSAFVYQSYLWDFGDAATSYTQNTSHAYASSGSFNITHTVTDINGCSNTVVQPVTINPKPACTISYTGPLSFCAGNNIVLNACPGFTSYQWFNNGSALPGQTASTFTAIQTGNYSFTALNTNGCLVMSDTVSVAVIPAPSATISVSGSFCEGGSFNIGVQPCNTCTFAWTDNAAPMPAFTVNQGSFVITPSMVGTHTFAVTVTDPNTGCSATDNITVTFNSNPTVSITVAPVVPVLCSNNIYNFTATTSASSPAWAWTYNFGNIILSATNTLNASAGGTYMVNVTDGITGCSASAFQVINPSPDLSLFPNGCDTLCDTSKIFLPLGSINGNIGNYTITWYNNAPPFTNVIGTGPSINLNSLPLGNNSISVIVINILTGCTDTTNNYNIFIRHCAGCSCDASGWDSLYWHHPNPPIDGFALNLGKQQNSGLASANIILPPVDTAFTCGQNLGIINCNSPITIFAKYKCNPASCDSAVSYVLTGPVTMTGIMPFNTSPLPAGNYTLTITGKCGDSTCKTCTIPFTIACDSTHSECSCSGSSWDSLYWHPATPAGNPGGPGDDGLSIISRSISGDNVIIPVVDSFFVCGQNLGQFSCSSPITIFAKYKCNPAGCDSTASYVLTGPVTGTGYMPFSTTGLPAGNYVLIVTGKCGDSTCNVCDIPFRIVCDTVPPNCCLNSHWEINPTWKNKTTNATLPIFCNESNFLISGTNCYQPFLVKGLFLCGPGCSSNVVYELYDSSTNVLLNSYTDSLLVPPTLASGSYYVKILAYCGGILCQTCKFNFRKTCACDCDSTKPIQLQVVTDGVLKKYNCGTKLPVINCNITTVLNATYTCKPSTCPPVITYVLTGPYNTTTGTLPLTLNSLAAGTYSISLTAFCNGKACKQCNFTFNVKCDSVPPPDCCPYQVAVSPSGTTNSLTPNGNGTIVNTSFAITGLTGVGLSEVKAEVLNYTIGSNFNNECLPCKTMPFTWASVSSASNIGTVSPAITLYGFTAPGFVPAGPTVYQNPREVVWSSASAFNITAPLGISFILPPPPVITCCEFSGTICVKFTFRDQRCRECEVIVCFPFSITNPNGSKLLFCPPIVGSPIERDSQKN